VERNVAGEAPVSEAPVSESIRRLTLRMGSVSDVAREDMGFNGFLMFCSQYGA